MMTMVNDDVEDIQADKDLVHIDGCEQIVQFLIKKSGAPVLFNWLQKYLFALVILKQSSKELNFCWAAWVKLLLLNILHAERTGKRNSQDTEGPVFSRFQLILTCGSICWKYFQWPLANVHVTGMAFLHLCEVIRIASGIPKFSPLSAGAVKAVLFDIWVPVFCQGRGMKCFLLPPLSQPTKSTLYFIKDRQ